MSSSSGELYTAPISSRLQSVRGPPPHIACWAANAAAPPDAGTPKGPLYHPWEGEKLCAVRFGGAGCAGSDVDRDVGVAAAVAHVAAQRSVVAAAVEVVPEMEVRTRRVQEARERDTSQAAAAARLRAKAIVGRPFEVLSRTARTG